MPTHTEIAVKITNPAVKATAPRRDVSPSWASGIISSTTTGPGGQGPAGQQGRRDAGQCGRTGTLAIGASATLLPRLLERRLGPTTAALLATGLYAGAAGTLAATALEQLRTAWPPVPGETVAVLPEDVRVATDTFTLPPAG